MGSIISQVIGVFNTPLGIAILALAIATVAGILLWAFWGQNDVKTDPNVNTPKIAPPMLAPTVLTGGAGGVAPRDFTLRNIFLGIVGVGAAIAVVNIASRGGEPTSYDEYADHAGGGDNVAYASALDNGRDLMVRVAYSPATTTTSTAAVSAAIEDPVCREAFTDEDSVFGYRVCTGRQAVQFDRIAFSRRGVNVLNASWNMNSGFTMSADNQAAPFGFDEHLSLVPTPGSKLAAYDAFVAIGLSEGTLSKDSDPTRLSAERAYALGRFVLTTLRGDTAYRCTSDAAVMAASLGTSTTYDPSVSGAMKPILLGVKFDERYPSSERDLTAAVNGFLRSRGTQITGYDLVSFGQREVLFVEDVCPQMAN